MGLKSKVFGAILLLGAVAAFLVNFGLWSPWIISGWQWLWNPLVYFFGSKLGTNIWLLGLAVSKGVAFIYSVALFVIGAFAVLR